MKKQVKYYVVWAGRQVGVFTTWEECAQQVSGYPGARYRAFASRAEAQAAFRMGYARFQKAMAAGGVVISAGTQGAGRGKQAAQPLRESYSVDAACSGNPGRLEYRCVHNPTRREVFREGPFENGTNNIGEFLALVQALILLKRKGIPDPVYSDSKIARGWVKRKQCKTKLAPDRSNRKLFDRIARAEAWLRENDAPNPVLAWDTEAWGEIPADFGRK
ncbi:MAG: ribonuclease H family protein [Anaerolineales bacterium]|nr:ribonuclease H family protein [Anaerolineales bacterium]